MAYFTNHASVSNQAHVQNVHGNIIFNEADLSHKRLRQSHDESRSEQSLDNDILASLSFPQMFDRRSHVDLAHPHTCQWLTHSHQFRHWQAQPRGLLWIKGKPGSGKSTLVSHLYPTLLLEQQSHCQVNLEFFFSGRGVFLQHSFLGMLRSLLNQIYYRNLDTRRYLRSAFCDKLSSFGSTSTSWEWALPELKRLFMDTISALAQQLPVVILVDALDEAGEDAARDIAAYFHSINDRIEDSAGSAKICISCRHYPIPSNIDAVEIHAEKHNRDDITLYVRENIKLSATPRQQSLDHLIDALVDRANGVFQWARFVTPMVTKWLSDGESMDQIQRSLSDVPTDLEAVYQHILTNVIDSRYRKKALRLFQWACLSQRPLSVTEARYAISAESIQTGPYPTGCHGVADFETSDSVMCRRVTAWSGGLLETVPSGRVPEKGDVEHTSVSDDSKQVIQVIHQSVMDFMLARGLPLLLALSSVGLDFSSSFLPLATSAEATQVSHGMLYRSCLKYLSTECLDEEILKTSGMNRRRESLSLNSPHSSFHYPLLLYSAQYGLYHAEQCGSRRGLDLEYESRLLAQSNLALVAEFGMIRPTQRAPHCVARSTVLHLAAAGNMLDLAKHQLDCGDSPEDRDERGWTPMHIAADQGNIAMISLLQRSGGDIHRKTDHRQTPLSLAASKGHCETFALLLSCGASCAVSDGQPKSVLCAAAKQGCLTICRLCIEAGINVNTGGEDCENALANASSSGNLEIVKLLFEAGADVNAQVRLLLENGADVDIHESDFISALQAASITEHLGTIRLLLENGADVNAQGGRYGNTLQAAAVSDSQTRETVRLEIVKLLLDAGADVNAQGGQHGSALQAAAAAAHGRPIEELGVLETVELLLNAGADVNAPGGRYGSALRAAQSTKRTIVTDLLLAAGAQPI